MSLPPERIIDSKLVRSVEHLMFSSPETVGTIKVVDVAGYAPPHDYWDAVTLNFPSVHHPVCSQKIHRVPIGWFEKGHRAEVLVRSLRRMPLQDLPEGLSEMIVTEPKPWMVAIRPLEQNVYGEPVDMNDERFKEMFHANVMHDETAPAFYEKFIKDKSRKIPPFSME